MDNEIGRDLEVDDDSVDNIQDEERSDFSATRESWLVPFIKRYCGLDKCPVYVVTQRELFNHPSFGYTSRTSIALKGSEYVINALSFHVESGTIANDGDVHELCHRFSNQLSYKFCSGIDWNVYEEKYQVIRYHLKSVRYSTSPFQRVDSVNCPLWFKQSVKARASEKYASKAMCSVCKRLKTHLDWQLKRTLSESPSRKVKRQAPSSKAKLSSMSPASQNKRKQNVTSERNSDKKKLRKYENTEVSLDDDQHDDLCEIVKKIEEVSKDDLEKAFCEGDIHGVGDKVREIWVTDRRHQLQQFREDQMRIGMCYSSLLNLIITNCSYWQAQQPMESCHNSSW